MPSHLVEAPRLETRYLDSDSRAARPLRGLTLGFDSPLQFSGDRAAVFARHLVSSLGLTIQLREGSDVPRDAESRYDGRMQVSVVVPAFNEEAGLGETLRRIRSAMAAFENRGWASELIVCDNNSTDTTGAIARAAGALVVFEPKNQIARARNTGAAQAKGDWLIFVDADSHPTHALFDDVADAIVQGRAMAGGSTVAFDISHPILRMAAWGWNALSRVNHWAAGSFVFCETQAFKAVGGFNEELFATEEIDLFRRLKRLARRRRRTIVILHRHPLQTSARKWRLYSSRELVVFVFKTIARRGRTLRSADECFAWYDGRR